MGWLGLNHDTCSRFWMNQVLLDLYSTQIQRYATTHRDVSNRSTGFISSFLKSFTSPVMFTGSLQYLILSAFIRGTFWDKNNILSFCNSSPFLLSIDASLWVFSLLVFNSVWLLLQCLRTEEWEDCCLSHRALPNSGLPCRYLGGSKYSYINSLWVTSAAATEQS